MYMPLNPCDGNGGREDEKERTSGDKLTCPL